MTGTVPRTMRAKMQVGMVQENVSARDAKGEWCQLGSPEAVSQHKYGETLVMCAVAKNGYDASGLDEDNTYAKMSPGAHLTINIANPALWGQFKHGDKFYVDFHKADK